MTTQRRYSRLLGAVLVAVLVASGCTVLDGDDNTATSTTVTTPATTSTVPTTTVPLTPVLADETTTTILGLDPTTPVARYLDALATGTATRVAAASDAASPGSSAAAYADYLSSVVEVAGDLPDRFRDLGTEEIKLCAGQSCTVYTDFVLGPDGLLSTFSVEGEPLETRLISNGATRRSRGISVELLSAYRTASATVFVVLEVTNQTEDPIRPLHFAATYTAVGTAAPADAFQSAGPESIEPTEAEQLLLTFEESDLGGTITLVSLVGDDFVEVPISLPVEPAP